MDILLQILIIATISSAIYVLISIGLTLTFGVLEFINFAHGEMAMIGAYTFFTSYIQFQIPLVISLIITALTVAALGILIERLTFRPVRDKQEFIPLVLAIGVSIILQSAAIMIYGAGSKNYAVDGALPTIYTFFDGKASITLPQVLIIATAIILTTALWAFLKYSKTGKAIRAVSDNKEVAAIMGINVDKTITTLFAIAAGLAAVAGVLVAFDQNLHPRMGILISIKAFAAIVLGGVGKFHGAIIGAIIIAFTENLVVGLTGISASYKELIVFTLFIFIILVKPYGIFGGRKEEMESR